MTIPLQVTFRGMDASEALRANIEKRAEKLECFCDNILSCRVVVEPAESHHHKGNRYRVRIHLEVPGQDLYIGHGPGDENRTHEDAYVAVRDAFNAMRRCLEDYARERRGDVKRHTLPPSVE